jgi:hypothetical protein
VENDMRRFLTLLLTLVPALGACSSKGDSCSDVVLTPGGPVAKACVHQIPDGATVTTGDDGATTVWLDGKVVATYPPCPCADANTCVDRNGATHSLGHPWTDGCTVCSCGDLGDGTLSPVCTHNACPPDGSADAL